MYPLSPSVESICVTDVAHHLSQICRFTGATRAFYSVAQHSVEVSLVVPSRLALAGLLHDAAEAYLGDVAGPLKHTREFGHYRDAERRLLAVVLEALVPGRVWLMEDCTSDVVRDADRMVLAAEARDLMAPSQARWGDLPTPLARKIVPMPPAVAEGAFLARFKELTI
jgi:hypothetical protein